MVRALASVLLALCSISICAAQATGETSSPSAPSSQSVSPSAQVAATPTTPAAASLPATPGPLVEALALYREGNLTGAIAFAEIGRAHV